MDGDLGIGGEALTPEDHQVLAGVSAAIAGAGELKAWWDAVEVGEAGVERFEEPVATVDDGQGVNFVNICGRHVHAR